MIHSDGTGRTKALSAFRVSCFPRNLENEEAIDKEASGSPDSPGTEEGSKERVFLVLLIPPEPRNDYDKYLRDNDATTMTQRQHLRVPLTSIYSGTPQRL